MQHKRCPKTLVHTFATDTYLPWAELFLEAVRYHHGADMDVRMDTYNVSEEDQHFLRGIYPGIDIRDRGSGYEELAEQCGVDIETVHEWRDQVARGNTTKDNFPFKLFISVDKRYRSLKEVVDTARQQGYEYVIHSDVDIYIRRPLTEVLEMMREYDVGLYFRLNATEHRRKTLGAFMIFRVSEGTDEYLEHWMNEIDAVPKNERWAGFGQSTQYFATEKSTHARFADFRSLPGAPIASKKFNKDAHLWLNSNSIIPGRGSAGLGAARRRSWNDLKQGMPRIPIDANQGVLSGELRILLYRIRRFIRTRLHL